MWTYVFTNRWRGTFFVKVIETYRWLICIFMIYSGGVLYQTGLQSHSRNSIHIVIQQNLMLLMMKTEWVAQRPNKRWERKCKNFGLLTFQIPKLVARTSETCIKFSLVLIRTRRKMHTFFYTTPFSKSVFKVELAQFRMILTRIELLNARRSILEVRLFRRLSFLKYFFCYATLGIGKKGCHFSSWSSISTFKTRRMVFVKWKTFSNDSRQ